jgi:hypothetical protein
LLIMHWPRWGGKGAPDESVGPVGPEESSWGTSK